MLTTIEILQENAIAEYTGLMLQATAPNETDAVVMLSFNIQDITCTDPADPDAGDIRNAIVDLYVDGALKSTSSTITLVNPGDSKTGTVSFPYTFDIGSSASETYEVWVEIGGYYVGSTESQMTMITVYKPEGDFITGGGYIVPNNSGGMYASTDGLKTNFGFNVKYNKKGNKLKGHMNIIFRRLETDGIHVYQIKSNSVQSLGVDASDPDVQYAQFITKANLTDKTDPLYPVSLGGNLTLKVDLTDNGEPGSEDEIAFNLTDGSTLLYSSNWTGISTSELVLTGGNIVVHSGLSELPRATVAVNEPVVEINLNETLELVSWPNPSDDYFYLKLKSKNTVDKINIQVFDLNGRLVSFKTGEPNKEYQIGASLQSGLYFVNVVQANTSKQIKLVKY